MNRFVTVSAAALLHIGLVLSHAADFVSEPYVGYGSGYTASGETRVSSASALASAAQSSGQKIVVSGRISNALIVCGSNKHFFGDGTAELEQVSFLIKDVSNVTIQNLTMHLPYPGSVSGQDHDGDVIHIEGSGARNIWIDHCDLSNEYDNVSKDTYDGLIDTKNGASNITISWNFIHDGLYCQG
ncbi:MAG: hypothetical protein JW768_01895 [Chitinispirillaceae bacterium]|nr:hypothetical protein [Chitinispirillaceae bacterium]